MKKWIPLYGWIYVTDDEAINYFKNPFFRFYHLFMNVGIFWYILHLLFG
jgi:hypothetical protein